jgi:hypothetical protein
MEMNERKISDVRHVEDFCEIEHIEVESIKSLQLS